MEFGKLINQSVSLNLRALRYSVIEQDVDYSQSESMFTQLA
jgi:hypothetical protein